MGHGVNRTSGLDYMQNMLRELRNLAEFERHDILAYMIEMAYIECSDVIRGTRPKRMEGSGGAETKSDRSG